MLGAVRKCISLWVVNAKTPSFMLSLLLIVRPLSDRQPPGPPHWNSNAYAIRRKCKKKIKCIGKSFQIIHLQFPREGIELRRGADCVIRVTVEQSRLRRY
jgi:hypothetical protein